MSIQLRFADQYFATARERYQIKLNKEAGLPFPWTKDRHFQTWRFCQVHREDDKTTIWLRQNIRESLIKTSTDDSMKNACRNCGNYHDLQCKHTEEQLLRILEATLIFRWFNRIETGAMVKDLLILGWDRKEAEDRLTGVSPIVTGAYIIKAGDGVSKLEGILDCIDEARPQLPTFLKRWTDQARSKQGSLYRAWLDLTSLHFMGGFMSYEVVSDLRWTPPLDNAYDILTWANAGPGCARGLGWVVCNDLNRFSCSGKGQREMLPLMVELLALSKDQMYWPQQWKPWEMREVEHWCCEFDKYKRAESGQALKRRYQV